MSNLTTPSCSSCGAQILWRLTEKGKRIPIDPEPVVGGNIVLDGHEGIRFLTRDEVKELKAANLPAYRSHFASCPDAQQHRRR